MIFPQPVLNVSAADDRFPPAKITPFEFELLILDTILVEGISKPVVLITLSSEYITPYVPVPKLKVGEASKLPPAVVNPDEPICVIQPKAKPVPNVILLLPVIVP